MITCPRCGYVYSGSAGFTTTSDMDHDLSCPQAMARDIRFGIGAHDYDLVPFRTYSLEAGQVWAGAMWLAPRLRTSAYHYTLLRAHPYGATPDERTRGIGPRS